MINNVNFIKLQSVIVYADLEPLIVKITGCKNNSKIKATEHISSSFSMYTTSSLKDIENKHDLYRTNECMKKLCESLRQHTMKKINFLKRIY